jgi:muconolactone delta-isomerase
MEFLVGFDVTIPDGTPESEVKERVSAEAIAAAGLARQGHLLNKGVFVSVGGRQPSGVVYETYLVQ